MHAIVFSPIAYLISLDYKVILSKSLYQYAFIYFYAEDNEEEIKSKLMELSS